MFEGTPVAHILVVDDDPSMRELVALHLRNSGYQVTTAEDAITAGRKLLSRTPDLLIVDVEMPYITGLEFASLLIADSTLTPVPTIMISAHDRYRERAEGLGVTFLTKPIQKSTLLEAVAVALQSAQGSAIAPQHSPALRPC